MLQSHSVPALQPSPGAPLWLRSGFWICIAISVVVVLRRLIALAAAKPHGAPQLVALDNTFSAHAALTLTHIIPALLFVLLAPIIVFRPSQQAAWAHRIFYPLGVIVGITAYAMSVYSVGGWTERSAVLLFDTLFLFSLARAFHNRGRAEFSRERRWQFRAIAIPLGIATTRPVMGVFFATARLTHLLPQQFFGMAFWIGFSVNVAVFELWIRALDRSCQPVSGSQFPNSEVRDAL